MLSRRASGRAVLVFLAFSFISGPVACAEPREAGASSPGDRVQSSHTPAEDAELLERLRAGGHVLFFRHERTDVLVLDDPDMNLDDCTTQRNLSLAGIASARQTGEYMERLSVPVGAVLSSPLCRCMETARHAFGRAVAEPRLRAVLTPDAETHAAQFRQLREVIAESFQDGTNTVLIGHFPSSDSYGVRLHEGDALVFRRDGDADPVTIGVIPANRWGDFLLDPAFRP